jgi:hypothetical protein
LAQGTVIAIATFLLWRRAARAHIHDRQRSA